MRKKTVLIIIAIIMTIMPLMSACKDEDGSGYRFKYGLSKDPVILDPQLADDEAAVVVLGNMYEGLLTVTDSGSVTEGVAENYTVSDNGLEYTFYLRRDNKWSTSGSEFSDNVTANDFVFAFKRIFDLKTKSPYTKKFLCIKNAAAIAAGQGSIGDLGVRAINDYTLRFELDYPDANFLMALTTTAASPCCEKFFNTTKGKYGLETDLTASNGPFYAYEWQYDKYSKDNYVILRKNKNYSESRRIFPSSLNFFVNKNSTPEADFYAGGTDVAVVSTLKNKLGNEFTEYKTTSYGIFINPADEYFSNINLRKALAAAVNRDEFSSKLSDGLTPAYAAVPTGVTMLNKSYRELVSEKSMTVFDENAAKNHWSMGMTELGISTLEGYSVIIPQSITIEKDMRYILQQWQTDFGFYCTAEVLPDSEYNSRIDSGDYQFALFMPKCEYNSPDAVLSDFKADGNRFGYSCPGLTELLYEASHSISLSNCVDLYANAEKLIIDDSCYIPLFYGSEYLVYSKDITDLIYNPFTRQIYFINAKNFD